SEFFQMQPEQCRGNSFSIVSNAFTLHSEKSIINGVVSGGAIFLADAAKWNSAERLISATNSTELPVVAGEVAMDSGGSVYLALKQSSRDGEEMLSSEVLPEVFAEAERYREQIAERVTVETPDAFINVAVPALCVAANAIWDEKQQSFIHGAVAWRVRL